MKLASWNVNGIRACARKGLIGWITEEMPHVLGLQETKASEAQIRDVLSPVENNYRIYTNVGERKGYSGVALLLKKGLACERARESLGIKKFDQEGRTVEAELQRFCLLGGYFPNGGAGNHRVPFKLEFSREMAKKALRLKKETGKGVIVFGDINTAHTPMDLANPRANKENTGFLPQERAWIDEFIGQGFVDAFRAKHPSEKGRYTYWSYRTAARERNAGWRLDYFFVSEDLAPKIKKAYHWDHVQGSDHCPVGLEI